MGSRACSRCGAQITFSKHPETGKWNPIDDEASPDGNIRFNDNGSYSVLAGDRLEGARAQGEKLHLSHFVTCPEAKSFRQ